MKYTELLETAGQNEVVTSDLGGHDLEDVNLQEANGVGTYGTAHLDDSKSVDHGRPLRYLITAEPVICLFQFAVGLIYPAMNALTYMRVCHMIYNDSDICDNLKNESYKVYEDAVQTKASHWYLTQHICFEAPALLLCFFYGSLGDHFSRRVTLALPCFGQLLAGVILVIIAYNKTMHVAWISFALLILGIFGGWITLLLASYSLISEVSSTRNRTFRISMGEGIESLSLAVALCLSGIILDNTSFQFVFFFSTGLLSLAIIYCFTWLKEPPRYVTTLSTCGRLRSVFELQKVKDAITTVFKRREDRNRIRLLVLLVSLLLGMISYYAMYTVGYLFLKKSPLGWSQSLYGYYTGYNRLVIGLASLVIVPVFKDLLRISDTSILLVGLLSSSLSELFLSFCTKTWMVFLVPLIGVFSQAKYTCYRSLMSQLVRPDELGKMFAMIGALQSLSGICGSSLYNSIYPKTLHFWPGFCFSLGMIVSIIPISITVWLHLDFKKNGQPPAQEVQEDYTLTEMSSRDVKPLMEDELFSDDDDEIEVDNDTSHK